ncbi:hypothetical protein EPUS_00238 [Endocarpon pusillum Z07020]|uniref:Uncharacterized protein n=1 Tax=Endocarpon pusillum (strain Z07020 / HMAS-L-300199) TaxID=1263415 RepID=U1HX97_ENDPU|nr:uncharacterized protein EPUS_00238 [Endocarpon pusillum Z07020]ERF75445.1 hypothetical protein EPUS_00238 [Endocarpon pusillum Z07020]
MAGAPQKPLAHADYTVACICPMGVELAPVEGMLDEIHDPLPTNRDQNAYTLGKIGGHNVVVAVLPEIGNRAAATVATQLLNDFPAIRFGLLVGIGGGVPGDEGEDDVRLGDVVVSQPTATFGGVVQYDLGKILADGSFERTGQLNKPPSVLGANVRKLQAQHLRVGSQILRYLSEMIQRYPRMQSQYSFPATDLDQLFLASYAHRPGVTCVKCDRQQTVSRLARSDSEPRVHYGTIGSANLVVKDPVVRDELKRDMKILCVEMEAAGLMDDFPCLVIRGICDYADSHKNKRWQPYAAAVASAYMKELLMAIPAPQVAQTRNAVESTASPFQLGLHLGEAPIIDPNLFVGRLSELEKMDEILQDARSQEQGRLILGGMGGIGKTQLAIAYARLRRGSYESIFWLNAASEAALKRSMRSMAERVLEVAEYEKLEDEQTILRVRRWLSETINTRWLLIFDNYDDPDLFDIRKYYPYAAHGSIITTTRLPDQISGKRVHVRPLEHISESLQVLETRSERPNVKDSVPARRLAERLEGLPLALATAGAYLQKSTLSFEQYLQEYEKRWNLSPRRPLQLQEYRNRTLYTTWDLSYICLKNDDPNAAKLLRLLAYFDHQNLWYELFQAGLNNSLPSWLLDITSNLIDFEEIMRVLVEYCFVETQWTTKSYSMHACVHDWTLASLNKMVDSESYWYAFDCVAHSIDGEWELLGHLRHARLAAHAARLGHDHFVQAGLLDIIADGRAEKVEDIAQLLQKQFRLEAAAVMHQRALAGYEKALGPDHTSTLDTVNNLGILYRDQGKLDEAEEMYMRALAGKEKALGPNHTSTLGTVHNLGLLYRNQGKLDEVEEMYMRALAGKEKALGPNHTSTLGTVHNLGLLYRNQGKLDEVEEMYMRALAGKEKALGPNHTSTLDTVHNLGLLYNNQGKLDEAEEMYMRALAGKEKALGPNHTSTLGTVNNLGLLYRNQGKLDEAEEMYMRALAGKEKALGPNHISTLNTVNNLGLLYYDQGKLDEAEEMYMRALAGKEKALGPNHTSTLGTVHNLGLLYRNQGKLDEVEEMYMRALAGKEKALGPNHTSTLDTVHNLGLLYNDQGKLDEAEKIPNHTSTLGTVHNLGLLYRNQGKLDEAEEMYMRALAGKEKALGPDHTSTLDTVHNLGLLYNNQGKLDEAEEMYMRALAGKEKALGPDHTSTLDTVHNLGLLYNDQGKLDEAEKMFELAKKS